MLSDLTVNGSISVVSITADSMTPRNLTADYTLLSGTAPSDISSLSVITGLKQVDGKVSISASRLNEHMVENLDGDLQKLSDQISTKIWIENEPQGISGEYSDLSVVKISKDDYREIVIDGNPDPRTIYILSSDDIDAYGQRIVNLRDGTDISDAVNYGQLSSGVKAAMDALSDYYTKTETSSSTEIQVGLNLKSSVSVDGV